MSARGRGGPDRWGERGPAGHGRAVAAAAGISLLAGAVGVLAIASALALVGSTVAGEGPSAATGWTAADDPATDTPDHSAALALLERAASVGDRMAYTGVTLSRTAGASPVRLEVTGVPGTGTIVRTDGVGVVLAGEGRSASLADASAVLGRLRTNYSVVRVPDRDRTVAGRPAEAVEARRADSSPAARFWVDSQTGLLLRRDLIAAGGRTTSSTWFTELTVGAAPPSAPHSTVEDPWPYLLSTDELAERRAGGCRCAVSLPGGLGLVTARVDTDARPAGPDRGVVHLLYSDGLITVSLFDQAGVLDDAASAELEGRGFTVASYAGVPVLERITRTDGGTGAPVGEWVWTCGTSIQTMIGPATPGAAARRRVADIVGALDPASGVAAPSGFLESVRRGADRVAGAVGDAWDAVRS